MFAQEASLLDEMRSGSRYPEGRSGNIDASIVTGRGVQALMGGFDTQVRSAQQVHAEALRDVIAMCFEMDEKLWPDQTRSVRGNDNGTPYSINYTPSKDIKGDYTIDVTYGLMAGLDPNRALVWGLQARGDKLISRDFLRRNLPVAINPSDEERRIDVEDMRDYLKQGVAGYIQSLPLMAQQGQDPAQVIRVVTAVVQGRKKGRAIEDLLEEAFEPPEQEEADQGQESGPPGMDGAPPGPGGLDQSGRMPGVAPGQQGMGPGGRPDMRQLLTSLSGNGQPRMSASVLKRQPIG